MNIFSLHEKYVEMKVLQLMGEVADISFLRCKFSIVYFTCINQILCKYLPYDLDKWCFHNKTIEHYQ